MSKEGDFVIIVYSLFYLLNVVLINLLFWDMFIHDLVCL